MIIKYIVSDTLLKKTISCCFFLQSLKRRYLKTFMRQLRRANTDKTKLKALFVQVSATRKRRGAGKYQRGRKPASFLHSSCTVFFLK